MDIHVGGVQIKSGRKQFPFEQLTVCHKAWNIDGFMTEENPKRFGFNGGHFVRGVFQLGEERCKSKSSVGGRIDHFYIANNAVTDGARADLPGQVQFDGIVKDLILNSSATHFCLKYEFYSTSEKIEEG